jgi:hypothetical protein
MCCWMCACVYVSLDVSVCVVCACTRKEESCRKYHVALVSKSKYVTVHVLVLGGHQLCCSYVCIICCWHGQHGSVIPTIRACTTVLKSCSCMLYGHRPQQIET